MPHYTRPQTNYTPTVADLIIQQALKVQNDSAMHYYFAQCLNDHTRNQGLAERSASLVSDLVECWSEQEPHANKHSLQQEAVAAVVDIQSMVLAQKVNLQLDGASHQLMTQIAQSAEAITRELDHWETRKVRSQNTRYQRNRYQRPIETTTEPVAEPQRPRRGRYSRNVDQSMDVPVVQRRGVPLVRIKEPGMKYEDHRTASLAFEDLPTAPKPTNPDFWGTLASPPETWKEGFVGSDGVIVGDQEYIALNAAHAEALMSISMNENRSILVKSGVVEYQFRRLELVHLFKDKNEFTTTIVNYPKLQALLINEHDLHGLAEALNEASESSTAQLVTKIVAIINRRATTLVNRFIALDLGVKNLRISDFREDWKELYEQHLVPKAAALGVSKEVLDTEIAKYGEAIVERAIRIRSLETPVEGSDDYDYDKALVERANALMDTDLTERVLVSVEHVSVTRLPVSAKDLGIAMDDYSSYVKASVTPELYAALEGIVERISDRLHARLYDSIVLITSDDVKFDIILTDERDKDDPGSPHFVLQVTRSEW